MGPHGSLVSESTRLSLTKERNGAGSWGRWHVVLWKDMRQSDGAVKRNQGKVQQLPGHPNLGIHVGRAF